MSKYMQRMTLIVLLGIFVMLGRSDYFDIWRGMAGMFGGIIGLTIISYFNKDDE